MSKLHDAVKEGNLAAVQKATTSSTVGSKDELQQTPLHIACQEGFIDIVQFLIKKKAPLNERDSLGWTPFMCAANCNNPEKIVELCSVLISAGGVDVGAKSVDGNTAMHYLVRFIPQQDAVDSYLGVIKSVIQAGASVHARNNQDETPLHLAALKCNLPCSTLLLQFGAKADVTNAKRESSLHSAVIGGNADLVKLLLNSGANRYLMQSKGETPGNFAKSLGRNELHDMIIDSRVSAVAAAVRNAKMNALKMFINGGQNFNQPDKHGLTALHHACTIAPNTSLNALLTSKLDINVNAVDEFGNTALHYLAANTQFRPETGSTDLVSEENMTKVIAQRMSGIFNTKNKQGETPLHIACLHNNVKIIMLLLENSVELNSQTSSQETCLHYAVIGNAVAVVETLLARGVDATVRNKYGETAKEQGIKLGKDDLLRAIAPDMAEFGANLSDNRTQSGNRKTATPSKRDTVSEKDNRKAYEKLEKELKKQEEKERKEREKQEEKERKEQERQKIRDEKERKEREAREAKEREKAEKERKKEEKRQSKMPKEKEVVVSGPTAVKHSVHVGTDYNWGGEDPTSLFQLEKKVGEGYTQLLSIFRLLCEEQDAFGAVYKAVHKGSGNVLAIKTLPAGDKPADLEREIAILKEARDPNIVSYYGSCVNENKLWILMEFCGCGSVADLLKKLNAQKRTMSENHVSCIVACVTRGLTYLHSSGTIHRDLKPANILLTGNGEVKIADFGVSAQLNQTLQQAHTTIGTPLYMSPEVIEGSAYDARFDVWSLGISTIEMAQGVLPHAECNVMRAIGLIVSGPPPTVNEKSKFSKNFHDFVAACCAKDPQMRKLATDLLQMPFIGKRENTEAQKTLREMLKEHYPEEVEAALTQTKPQAGTLLISSSDSSPSSSPSITPTVTTKLEPLVAAHITMGNGGNEIVETLQATVADLQNKLEDEQQRNRQMTLAFPTGTGAEGKIAEAIKKELAAANATIHKQKAEIEQLKQQLSAVSKQKEQLEKALDKALKK